MFFSEKWSLGIALSQCLEEVCMGTRIETPSGIGGGEGGILSAGKIQSISKFGDRQGKGEDLLFSPVNC